MGKTNAIAGLVSALAASASFSQSNFVAFADGPFNFPPFSSSSPTNATPQSSSSSSSSSTAQSQPSNLAQSNTDAAPRTARNDNPRTTSAGFDPEALERGAKALREITSSSHAKKVLTGF